MSGDARAGRLERFFAWMLAHRALAAIAVLAFTAALGAGAACVVTDPSVEAFFPVWEPARQVYDRYKERFPFEDARAIVVVEAQDLWTPAGLARVKALEDDLARVPSVVHVDGPLSVRDVSGDEESVFLEKLFPRADLPPAEVASHVARARTDPLFAWRIAHPTLDVASIEVDLEPDAAESPAKRSAFWRDANAVLAKHAAGFARLELTGIPAIRARFIEQVNGDMGLLLPLALLATLLLLALIYRSARLVFAALATILACVFWTIGVMGAAGVPIGILTSFAPIIVMVISISDTVHIVNDVDERVRRGEPRLAAIAAGVADSAGPCLLTEITIAAGFVSLALVNIVAILEFGLVTAAGMLLAWLANMTVLPLVLSLGGAGVRMGAQQNVAMSPHPPGPPPPLSQRSVAPATAPDADHASGLLLRGFRAFVAAIERQIVRRPRTIVACALLVVAAGIASGSRIRVRHFVFDDLRPESEFWQDLRYAERAHGGLVPLAIFLEPEEGSEAAASPAPALEPAAVRFLDRAEARLRELPQAKTVVGPALYLRKAHRNFAGEEVARETGGLPPSRALAVQEIEMLDDKRIFRDVLTTDRRSAAVFTVVPDAPSSEVAALVGELEAWAAREAPPGYDAHVTGVLVMADRINGILLGGLVKSFAAAAGVTLLVFCAVLRSARLAVIGLIPNLTPIFLMLGVMAALGIDLKPSTVLLFAMVLTIADDDTIQFLTRFRRRFLAGDAPPDPAGNAHRAAALATLRESGLPMFVTSVTLSTGFALLNFSEFEGTANIGIITAVTLFSAVFADAFVAPVVIAWWRPRIGAARAEEEAPAPEAARAS